MKKATLLAIALLVSSLPLLAADPVIHRGIDVFTTTDAGTTSYDFAKDPIPAGFFCKDSAPFTGRVVLKGLPLETAQPGQLRGADTVIERTRDAAFDANGRATTRIKLRALSLVSVAPVETSCGAFNVYVTLAGEQRATTMSIYRTQELGGHFAAPLAVDARMRFEPASGQTGGSLELVGRFTLPAKPLPWSYAGGPGAKVIEGTLLVDADRDGVAETTLPGTSNFAAGWTPGVQTVPLEWGECQICEPETCHDDGTGKVHCSGPIYACGGYYCP